MRVLRIYSYTTAVINSALKLRVEFQIKESYNNDSLLGINLFHFETITYIFPFIDMMLTFFCNLFIFRFLQGRPVHALGDA